MSCFNIAGDMALRPDETDCIFVTDADAVLQQIKTGAQVFAGTWHFDPTKGIDYLEDILVNNPDMRLVRTTFWAFFASVPGVTEVIQVNLSLDKVARILSVQFVVAVGATQIAETIALQFPT